MSIHPKPVEMQPHVNFVLASAQLTMYVVKKLLINQIKELAMINLSLIQPTIVGGQHDIDRAVRNNDFREARQRGQS